MECTVTVFRSDPEAIPVPSSSLHQHLGELLASKAWSDVTFTVSGESFPAHKNVLAVRSPVFMAEFFGHMKEKRSQRVEIKDMDAAILGAMLRFIYTDSLSDELADHGDRIAIARGLLVVADRYGMERLKLICDDMLCS